MEKLTCSIVRDLFPSYRENLLSDEIMAEMEKHLAACPDCKKAYEEFGKEQAKIQRKEEEREKEEGSAVKKIAGTVVKFTLGFAAVTVTLLVVLFLVMCGVLMGPFPKVDKGISRYNTAIDSYLKGDKSNIHSGLICFPEKLSGTAAGNEGSFYAVYQETFDPMAKIFLECTYSEEEFTAEIDRLMHEQVYGGILKDDGSRFPYPAYYAIADTRGDYEYALITGENRIAYIALLGWENTRKIPDEYLPLNYNPHIGEKDRSTYYSAYDEYPTGYGRSTYTRFPEQAAEAYYYRKTGNDTFFLIRTEKNGDDKEIISRCIAGKKAQNSYDLIETEPEETKTLAGLEFESVDAVDGEIRIIVRKDGREEIFTVSGM